MIDHLRLPPAPLDFLRLIPTTVPTATDLSKMNALAVVNEGGTWHVCSALIAHENLAKILKTPGGVRRTSEYPATTARVEYSNPSVDLCMSPGCSSTSFC